MRARLFLVLSLILAAALPAVEELTVEQCIAIGLQNSKLLRASQMKLAASEGKEQELRTALYPALKFSGSYSRLSRVPPFEIDVPLPPPFPSKFVISSSPPNYYNLQLTLQQPLFTGFALESAVAIGKRMAQASEQDYLHDRNEFIFAIMNAYWNVYRAQEFQKLIDENSAMVQSHLADVQHFFEQGLAKNNDVLKVQVQDANMKVLQLEAKNSVRLAMMALNSLIGRPVYGEVAIKSRIDSQPLEFSRLEELVDKGLALRPEINSLQSQVKAAEAAVKLARAGLYPQVFLLGNYYYSRPNQRILPTEDKFKNTWDVSLGISFDIWSWGKTLYQIKQAKAQLVQAQEGLGQAKDGVTLEISQNWFNLQQSREKINLSDAAVAQAQENYRVTNERFKSGLASNSDLLDAEVALLQAQLSRTQALVDFELAKARLRKSVEKEF